MTALKKIYFFGKGIFKSVKADKEAQKMILKVGLEEYLRSKKQIETETNKHFQSA